jgi:signal transduction histidine kinase
LTYFLSVVSHELRSPLAAIENYLQVLLGGFAGELTAKQERMMKRCVVRVTDLRGQIGDVVDLARMRPEQIQTFEPIVGAPRRLRQVFTNLLNNAIRYSPPGSTVTFRAWYEPDTVYLEVQDEGGGILPEDLPHIFKDFYRSSSNEGASGMGLGLSIAKKIVEAHNGQILVRNVAEGPDVEEGKTGASFTVLIPRDLKTPQMRRQMWLEDTVNE